MRTVSMQWNLRQVMADRAIFATSELVPLLAERDIHLSREHVYRLVTKTPQRLNTDVLVALCDILACTPNDLITPVVEEARPAKTGCRRSRYPAAQRSSYPPLGPEVRV